MLYYIKTMTKAIKYRDFCCVIIFMLHNKLVGCTAHPNLPKAI